MNTGEILMKMKEFQIIILEYLDNDDYHEEKFDNILSMYGDFQQNKHKIKSIIYLLIEISNNHHRCKYFFIKIFRIFNLLKSQIKQFFSNDEIFNFFQSNKRILLFLIEEKILIINESIALKMINQQYSKYFYPELKPYLKYDYKNHINELLSDNFEEKRRIGENDNYICKLIRNDSVQDFIAYVNKTNLSLRTKIEASLFETNQFLLNNSPSLIEYSAFYGSIQIFQYLNMNQAKLNSSLWLYVIHGSNADMIHFLEENRIKPFHDSYEECLEESIKCHHNDIATYIYDNLISNTDQYISTNNFFSNIIFYSYHYHNYHFFPDEVNQKYNFYYACKFDYYDIVEYFLNENKIDINEPIMEILNVLILFDSN